MSFLKYFNKNVKPKAINISPFVTNVDSSNDYELKIQAGVKGLESGNEIRISDDGRGYELALDIKRQFILNYQLRMAKKIQINGNNGEININFKL